MRENYYLGYCKVSPVQFSTARYQDIKRKENGRLIVLRTKRCKQTLLDKKPSFHLREMKKYARTYKKNS